VSQHESIKKLPFISHKVAPITDNENEWSDYSDAARAKLQAWDLDTQSPDFVRQLAEAKNRIVQSSTSIEVPVYYPEAPRPIERSHIRIVSPMSRKRQNERFIDSAFPMPNTAPTHQVLDKYS